MGNQQTSEKLSGKRYRDDVLQKTVQKTMADKQCNKDVLKTENWLIASQEDILYVFHDMGKTEFCVAIEALEGKRGRGKQQRRGQMRVLGLSGWLV